MLNKNFNLILYDYILGAMVALNLGARTLTIAIATKIVPYVHSINAIETNPGGQAILAQSYITFIATAMTLGTLIFYYIWLRSKRDKSEWSMFAFKGFTIVFFVMILMDFLNDLGVWIGINT